MSETTITLPGGDTVIIPGDRRNITMFSGDLYKYRLVDQSQDVIEGGGKYIPKVNDLVIHYDLHSTFRVSYVDPTTYVANLSEWNLRDDDPEVSEEDKFLTTGSGYQSESWRAYLDTRTLPYRLEIDEGFRVYGNRSAYIKIFRGIDTSPSGEIVSAYYNQNGEYIGDSVPLEVVANVTDSVFSPNAEIVNTAIKAPVVGYTTKDLGEGEYLTVVAYSQAGIPVRSARLICHKTNVYRRVEDSMKRVTGIQLITPYLSESELDTLYVPLNINVASLVLNAKVTYSNGDSVTMPVGDEDSGAKFMIYGLKYWSPTIPGTPQRLRLVYRLSAHEEYSRMEGESENGLVREEYQIVATEVDPSMSLKLFVYPVWQPAQNAYNLSYWLFDLTRSQFFKVPANSIEFDTNSRTFDGADFTTVQTLTLAVRLGDLDPAWGTHRHVQTVQVALVKAGSLRATNWRVRHSHNQAEWFGDNREALVTVGPAATRIFDITCGYVDQTEWLENIYYAQEPLFDPMSEARAPVPTHFILTTNTHQYDFPIASWNTQLAILNDLTEGQSIFIRFVRRDVNGELQLATTALPLHNL